MTGIQLAPPPNPYGENLAQALMKQGMDNSPVRTPVEGLGKLSQSLVGALLQRQMNDQNKAHQQSANDALTQALLSSLAPTVPGGTAAVGGTPSDYGPALDSLSVNVPESRQLPPQGSAAEAAVNLMTDPASQALGNQVGLNEVIKQAPTFKVLSEKDAIAAGIPPEVAKDTVFQQDITNGPNGQISKLTTGTNPKNVSYIHYVTGVNGKGQLVQNAVGYDNNSNSMVKIPGPEVLLPAKAPPVQAQKEMSSLVNLAAASDAAKLLISQTDLSSKGPIGGVIANRFAKYGVTRDMTPAAALNILQSHYMIPLIQFLGSRPGYAMLNKLSEILPQPQYSKDRNLAQVQATEGMISNTASSIVGTYANTGYNVLPEVVKLAKSSKTFDPDVVGSGAQSLIPSMNLTPQIQDGATATGPNGEKIVMKGGQWVDASTGQPYGK